LADSTRWESIETYILYTIWSFLPPEIFIREMYWVIEGLEGIAWTLIVMDGMDYLVYGKEEYDWKVNKGMDFLGFSVSAEGVKLLNGKVENIKNSICW